LRWLDTQSSAPGASAGHPDAYAIRVSSPSARRPDPYLIEMVTLATKVQPREVWVERWALI